MRGITVRDTVRMEVEVPFSPDMMFLRDTDKKKKYQDGAHMENPHYGQLKLLISELAFFLYFTPGDEDITVVYIGAVPGNHISLLAEMFPRITWHLYDGGSFYHKLEKNDRVTLHKRYFTTEDAEKWKEEPNIFLISDLRTIDKDAHSTSYDFVRRDMQMQKEWVEIIRPVSAILKMKFPFFDKGAAAYIRYLDGVLMYGIFSPPTTTETRLIVNRPKDDGPYPIVDYNIKTYDDRLVYYNLYTRSKNRYLNPITTQDLRTDIINNHFDSRALLYLCNLYYTSHNGKGDVITASYALYTWIWRSMGFNASTSNFFDLVPSEKNT